MYGEQHPGQLGMAPPNPHPVAGNHAGPDAMLAYAAAAYAQYMQQVASQQHAWPMHAPTGLAPQQHHALPMHVLGAAPMAPLPPKKRWATANSKRVQAEDAGASMWTLLVCLVIGAVIGFACDREICQPQQQQLPQQQLRQ